MAHILQRAYVLPAVSSLWQRHSAHGQVLALTKLATHAQSAGVSVGLTSLRDWHLDQQRRQYRATGRHRARVYAAATDSAANTKHKVVFLGTPDVSHHTQ